MDGRALGLLALGGLALLTVNSQAQNSVQGGEIELTPSQDDGEPAAGMGALGSTQGGYYAPSQWFDAGQYVKIYIPFPTRSVRVGSNSYQQQFQYGGRWYTVQNLFRVWNPIRQLPGWLR